MSNKKNIFLVILNEIHKVLFFLNVAPKSRFFGRLYFSSDSILIYEEVLQELLKNPSCTFGNNIRERKCLGKTAKCRSRNKTTVKEIYSSDSLPQRKVPFRNHSWEQGGIILTDSLEQNRGRSMCNTLSLKGNTLLGEQGSRSEAPLDNDFNDHH
jgi:hypothetical protein